MGLARRDEVVDGGELFIGASGARPRFECRNDERGECVAILATLKGANGAVAERIVYPAGAAGRSGMLSR